MRCKGSNNYLKNKCFEHLIIGDIQREMRKQRKLWPLLEYTFSPEFCRAFFEELSIFELSSAYPCVIGNFGRKLCSTPTGITSKQAKILFRLWHSVRVQKNFFPVTAKKEMVCYLNSTWNGRETMQIEKLFLFRAENGLFPFPFNLP